MEITEEKAREILDFIAKKLGYEKADLFSKPHVQCVKMESGLRDVLFTFKMGRRPPSVIVSSGSGRRAVEKVLGALCFTNASNGFQCPESLEEMLVTMDVES